ncbi:hypothetical protein K1X76_03775 [bacterium]|nr:hypothetical protein [bacterium]
MTSINPTGNLDMESMLNNLAADFGKGDIEDKKASKAQISSQAHKIRDKRADYIDNLKRQMHHAVGGGCFKFLRVVTKVFDFLLKPLSAVTMGQFKIELTKTLDMLKDAKNQQALLGLKVKSQEILKVIDSLKKMMSDDTSHLQQLDEHTNKESQRIMEILNEIEQSFSTLNKI